jgi:ribosomal protein S18 acetylase RimI-like enzyme
MDTHRVWPARPEDAGLAARLLVDFNAEFEEPAPPPDVLARRLVRAMAHDASVLFGSCGGEIPQAIAVLRFRPALWVERLECYLAELYVVPAERGRGLGRALLNRVIEHARERGAGYIDLNADEPDTPARALYDSAGFSHTCGRPDGPVSYYYEREL